LINRLDLYADWRKKAPLDTVVTGLSEFQHQVLCRKDLPLRL